MVGLVGSYREGGVVDSAVQAVLEAAAAQGARTERIFLMYRHLVLCTNDRTCMQASGPERGRCRISLQSRGRGWS